MESIRINSFCMLFVLALLETVAQVFLTHSVFQNIFTENDESFSKKILSKVILV